jgi:hypothetical protein
MLPEEKKTKLRPWFVGATKVYSSVGADMIPESFTHRIHARGLNDVFAIQQQPSFYWPTRGQY